MVLAGENMIITTNELSTQIDGISNINNKISRMLKNKEIYSLKKGLYETDINANRYYLANKIYGPSYISFQTALAFYNMIPEKVYGYYSASMSLNKSKKYHNDFGTFCYKNIPSRCFPYGIITIVENSVSFDIASKEKALCDMLYAYPIVNNIKEIKELLFDDLRIDLEIFKSLDKDIIYEYINLYRCKNVTLLAKYIKRI